MSTPMYHDKAASNPYHANHIARLSFVTPKTLVPLPVEHQQTAFKKVVQSLTQRPQSKAAVRVLTGLSLLTRITTVQYGTYDGVLACLICFRFDFICEDPHLPVDRAQLTVTFVPLPPRPRYISELTCGMLPDAMAEEDEDGEVKDQVVVIMESFGKGSARNRPPDKAADVRTSATAIFTGGREEPVSMVGNPAPASCESHQTPNSIRYDFADDARQSGGETPIILAAVVIKYDDPIQGAVVRAQASLAAHPLAAPWTQTGSALFVAGGEYGPKVRPGRSTVDFATLTRDDWVSFLALNPIASC